MADPVATTQAAPVAAPTTSAQTAGSPNATPTASTPAPAPQTPPMPANESFLKDPNAAKVDDKAFLKDPATTKEGEVKPADAVKEPAKEAPKAPEKYEFKLPEGFKMDEKQFAPVQDILKAHNVPAEVAQKLADFHTNSVQEAVKSIQTAQQAAVQADREALLKDSKLGGAHLDETKALAGKTWYSVKPLLSKETQQALEPVVQSGGKAITEFLRVFAERYLTEAPARSNDMAGKKPALQGFNYDSVSRVFGNQKT